jgi:octaprenyl-diphosphate synthase
MIRRKTGSMIEAPLEAGALLGGADATLQRRFRLFGSLLGTAFQIVDDAIDYLGSEDEALKTLGADLRRRSGSAMLTYCRARCSPPERAVMERALARFGTSGDPESLSIVMALLRQHDAIGFSQHLCARTVARARRLIAGVGVEPARTDLDVLARMVGYWGLLGARLPDEDVAEAS